MLIARIVAKITAPHNFTEQEAIQFCEKVDIDGELSDKILAVIVQHCNDKCPELADLLAYRIE